MENNLVGIVVISHSNDLAKEIINLTKIFNQENFNIENGGNPEKETYGTTVENVKNAIKKANQGKGVLVFVDMGSSVFLAQQAKKELEGEIEVEIANAPLVEGIVSAVAINYENTTLEELKIIAEESREFNKIK